MTTASAIPYEVEQPQQPEHGRPKGSPIAYSIKQAAASAGVSRSQLYNEIANGNLPARKRGRSTLVLHDDLIAWAHGLPLMKSR
jgi:excisionase family DNA binding protein